MATSHNSDTEELQVVKAFAAAVRAELSDLSQEDALDLTDGLEADLHEHLADNGKILAEPASYAAELRSAAGLPPRQKSVNEVVEDSAQQHRKSFREVWTEFRQLPSVKRLAGFFISLRPVWWVLRGWAAYQLIYLFVLPPFIGYRLFFPLPINFPYWVALILCVIISVQWGRKRWMDEKILPVVKVIISIITAIALPLLFGQLVNAQLVQSLSSDSYQYLFSGMYVDGNPVYNIYAYDCAGLPMQNVRLFDQYGNPLSAYNPMNAYYDDQQGIDVYVEPNSLASQLHAWNTYPLPAHEMLYSGGNSFTGDEIAVPYESIAALNSVDDCSSPVNNSDSDETQASESPEEDPELSTEE